jgi:hypothetical protein
MKRDVLALAEGRIPGKPPSKETLNHAALVALASGLDPFERPLEAFREAYRSLGIDLINRVPTERPPAPLVPGEVRDAGGGYAEAALGLYNTVSRQRFPFASVEEFWRSPPLELRYRDLRTPVPHPLEARDIQARTDLLGDVGLYYCMLYTTLFMWGVEYLGWEVFLLAAASDPAGFDETFLQPAFAASLALIEQLAQIDTPFVFCHDDLADGRGPVFAPGWYERYIFPRYQDLWRPVKGRGKKLIFVADGNMGPLLSELRQTGVDGVMLENPATDFERILAEFSDRIVIGGVETAVLNRGSPGEIRRHVLEVNGRAAGIQGFVMSTPGGIHGNIPLENLESYFDARVRSGHTPAGWRKG